MDKNEVKKEISKQLFESYSLTMQLEKKELAASRFNDLNIKDLHIIYTIAVNKNLTITEIAKKLCLTKATLTSTIDKLEKLKYVLRERNNKDRRVINITLTKKGRLLYRLYDKLHKEYMENLFGELSSSELDKLNYKINSFMQYLQKEINEK